MASRRMAASAAVRPSFEMRPAAAPQDEDRSRAMKLKLHHVNLCSTNLPAMDKFYREVLDMAPEPSMARDRIKDQGYPGDVSFVTDGTTQFHFAETRSGHRLPHRTGGKPGARAATSRSAPTTSRRSRSGSTKRASNIPTMAAGRWRAGTRFSSTIRTATLSRCTRRRPARRSARSRKSQRERNGMATFVVAHGAWSAAGRGRRCAR